MLRCLVNCCKTAAVLGAPLIHLSNRCGGNVCWFTLNHVVCSFMQDLQDRLKKEAKKEMDERGIMERDEAAAAREDDDYQVSISYSSITQNILK